MKDDKLVSIIIPVYNIEEYIDRCMNSVLNQTYHNLEILLIDDGSTDLSGEKCKYWTKKDNRVKYFHKKNGGLSDARNYALDRVTGKYVTFIDGDDFVAKDFIEIMHRLLVDNKSDISVCINTLYYDNDKLSHVYLKHNGKFIETKDKFSMLEEMLYQKKFDTNACIKMFKTKLFKEIRFPEGKLYEDLDTIYKVFLKADKITYINKELYYYYQRSSSIVGKPFDKKDMYIITAIDNMLSTLTKVDKENNLNNKLVDACTSKLLSVNFYILRRTKLKKEYSKYNDVCINNIKKYSKLNKKARFKNNVAVLLFKINPKLIVIF